MEVINFVYQQDVYYWSLNEDILRRLISDYIRHIKNGRYGVSAPAQHKTDVFSRARKSLNHQVDSQTYRRAKKVRNEPQDHRKTLVKMDDPNITMEEYIRLEEERARRRGEVYNWETAMYGKIWDDEDVYDLRSVETEFPTIDQTINLNRDDFGHESNEDENNNKKKNNNKNAKKRKRKPSERIVYRADPVKNGTKNMNLHWPKCDFNHMNEESLKPKKLSLTKDTNGDGEGCSSGTLQN
ncbi:hypothetical protein Tco_0767778 [Tanacetum coccineum]